MFTVNDLLFFTQSKFNNVVFFPSSAEKISLPEILYVTLYVDDIVFCDLCISIASLLPAWMEKNSQKTCTSRMFHCPRPCVIMVQMI